MSPQSQRSVDANRGCGRLALRRLLPQRRANRRTHHVHITPDRGQVGIVLILGSIGLAIAAAVLVTGIWALAGAVNSHRTVNAQP